MKSPLAADQFGLGTDESERGLVREVEVVELVCGSRRCKVPQAQTRSAGAQVVMVREVLLDVRGVDVAVWPLCARSARFGQTVAARTWSTSPGAPSATKSWAAAAISMLVGLADWLTTDAAGGASGGGADKRGC
jgi:hypothetical protein